MDSIDVVVAQYFLYLSVLITAAFWLRSARATKIELTVRLALGGVLALALANIAGRLYYDPRPFVTQHITPLFAHGADNGFPSDHALFTSFLAMTVLLYSRRVGVILLAIAVAVGVARVAAHVHSPLDIVASFVFSALAAVAAAWVTRRRWLRSLARTSPRP